MMGASNPHPHCQVWSTEHIPDEPQHGAGRTTCVSGFAWQLLALRLFTARSKLAQRVVCENQEFVALVPFWAVWPFETMVLSRRHHGSFTEMNHEQRVGLADILKQVTTRYDNLFQTSFPYTMGFHQSPTDSKVASRMAFPCTLLSATAAICYGSKIHGWI